MATLGLGTSMTLAEIVRRKDPKGNIADIVNVLNETNEIVQDVKWEECNNGTYHEATRLATKPTGALRAYNMGVASEVSVTEKITEPTSMRAGMSKVDETLLRHTGNPALVRAQEDAFYMEGMVEQFVRDMFDGNRATSPLSINGINNRADYNVQSSEHVFDNAKGNASATANKSSIYIVQWGDKMVNALYPRGDAAGGSMPVKSTDYGVDLVNDDATATRQYPAYRTWLELHYGLFIYDPRCIKRLSNISTTNIDGVDDFMFDEELAMEAIAQLEYGRRNAVMYCNKDVLVQIQWRANQKTNAFFTQDKEAGDGSFAKPVYRFNGVPIRIVDAITSTQAKIS